MSITPQDIAYQEAHADENIGYRLIIPVAIWLAVGLISLLARLYSRRMSKIHLGSDDYLAVASMVFAVALSITTFLIAANGVGRHLITLPKSDLVTIGKLSFVLEFSYTPCLALAKLSICALYLRIFTQVDRWFRISVYTTIVWICLWMVGTYLGTFLSCLPAETIWTEDCAPPESITIATGVLNVISDIALLVLPQPIVWGLQMPVQRKLCISVLLALGLFATLISIIRIPLIIQTAVSGVSDLTYGLVITDVLTVLEPLTVIICANIPVTQTLWRRFAKSSMGLSTLRSILRGRRSKTEDSEVEMGRSWKVLADSNQSSKNAVRISTDRHKGDFSNSSAEGILRRDSVVVA